MMKYGVSIQFLKKVIKHSSVGVVTEEQMEILNKKDDFIAFGYFDSIRTRKYTSFYDATNNYKIENLKKYNYDSSNPVDMQEIYAYTESLDDLKILNIGDEGEYREYPLIVITQIKYNESYQEGVNGNKNESSINKIVLDCMENVEEYFILEYKIFKTIGHSDRVIVFRSNSYRSVFEIIENIRRNERLNVKSSYSVTGLGVNDDQNEWDKWIEDVSLKSISFRYGVDTSANYKEILDSIHVISSLYTGVKVDKTTFFGRYDFDVTFSNLEMVEKLKTVIDESSNIQVIHPGYLVRELSKLGNRDDLKTIIHKDIKYVNTKWKYDAELISAVQPSIDENMKDEHGGGLNANNLGKMRKIKYNSRLDSLFKLFDLYNRIIETESSDAFAIEMNRVFDTYLNLLIGESISTFVNNDSFEISSSNKENELLTSINVISQAFFNRIQSSRFLYEAPVYNMFFTGSVTKLYMAYYASLFTFENRIEQMIESRKKNGDTGNYQQVTFAMSQLLDNDVKTNVLLTNSLYKKKKLAFVVLDTRTFLEPKVSTAFLVHEIGHHIPSFEYENRNKVFMKIAKELIATMIYKECVAVNFDEKISNLIDISKGECIKEFFYVDVEKERNNEEYVSEEIELKVMEVFIAISNDSDNKVSLFDELLLDIDNTKLESLFVNNKNKEFEEHNVFTDLSKLIVEQLINPVLNEIVNEFVNKNIELDKSEDEEKRYNKRKNLNETNLYDVYMNIAYGFEQFSIQMKKDRDKTVNSIVSEMDNYGEGISKKVISKLREMEKKLEYRDIIESVVLELNKINIFNNDDLINELGINIIEYIAFQSYEVMLDILNELMQFFEEIKADLTMVEILEMNTSDYVELVNYYKLHNVSAEDNVFVKWEKRRLRTLAVVSKNIDYKDRKLIDNFEQKCEILRCKVKEMSDKNNIVEGIDYKKVLEFIDNESIAYISYEKDKSIISFLEKDILQWINELKGDKHISQLSNIYEALNHNSNLNRLDGELNFVNKMWEYINSLEMGNNGK